MHRRHKKRAAVVLGERGTMKEGKAVGNEEKPCPELLYVRGSKFLFWGSGSKSYRKVQKRK